MSKKVKAQTPKSLSHEISVSLRPLAKGLITSQTLKLRLNKVLSHPLLAQDINRSMEMSVSLVSDEEIQELNRDYRGKDKPTDVLSFAQMDGEEMFLPPDMPMPLGDIIISVQTAQKQAENGCLPRLASVVADRSWGIQEEISFLMLHGLLHLLGYDHEDSDEEAEEMEGLELKLLPIMMSWEG